MPEAGPAEARFLKDLWNDGEAEERADRPLDLLRYRSNLLGADLRITNFGGGNTSSKFELPDPLTGEPTRVLAVKGSGGDLGSIDSSGFAILYQEKLEKLVSRYRGEEHEDEMVELYPLCAFGMNRVAASIDTPLHALLPFDHIDHLHPDWAIALAASANGSRKLQEFNKQFGRALIWVPWQRPGFELAMMLRKAVEANAGCEGLVLGSHGLFTWGNSQRECYENSLRTINQIGEFVESARTELGASRVWRRGSEIGCRLPGDGRGHSSVSARTSFVKPAPHRSLRKLRGCHGVRELPLGGGTQRVGHELSRPLPEDAYLPDVRSVGS